MTKFNPPVFPYCGPAKFHGERENRPIRRLVIHCTVSPCEVGGARNVARYFRDTVTRPSSAHVIVDPGEAVQVVYDSWVAYHAPPNPGSIGIELCDPMTGPASRWDDENHRRMLRNAAIVVARYCLSENIPPWKIGPAKVAENRKGVCGHADVSVAFGQTNHTDPGTGFPWRKFMRQVRREVERLSA